MCSVSLRLASNAPIVKRSRQKQPERSGRDQIEVKEWAEGAKGEPHHLGPLNPTRSTFAATGPSALEDLNRNRAPKRGGSAAPEVRLVEQRDSQESENEGECAANNPGRRSKPEEETAKNGKSAGPGRKTPRERRRLPISRRLDADQQAPPDQPARER